MFAEPFDSSIAQKYIDSKGMISAENRKCIWLEDGKVKSCGLSTDEQREVSKWKNVIKVDSGEGTFYGLAANGKVFCTDNNDFDKSEVSLWKEVKDISASKDFVAGLTNQGTIVLAGDFDKSLLQGSKNSVIQIETLDEGIAMLDKSGKVTVLGNIAEQFNRVKEWNDILYISGGSTHLVGITKDGKVVADGEGFFGQCDVNGMENITFAYAGKYDTVLVLTNGKCFAVGKNKKRLSHLMKESQITAIDESEKELAILDKNRKLKVINDN